MEGGVQLDDDDEDEEGENDEEAVEAATLEAKRKLIDSMDLSRYAIQESEGGERDWSQAEAQVNKLLKDGGVAASKGLNSTVSVKGVKRALEEEEAEDKDKDKKKKGRAAAAGKKGGKGGGGAKTGKKVRR